MYRTRNLFDFNTEYSNDHFLHLKILRYAESHLTNISEMGRGFVEINRLMLEAHNLSISPKAIEDSLLRLARRNLIMLDTRSRETVNKASHFRITECGNYYLNELIKTFVYLDLVWTDTPIADKDIVTRLRTLIDSLRMDFRFKRTRIFLDYLLQMEEKEKSLHPEHASSPLGRYWFTKNMISGFENEKKRIKQILFKRYYRSY